MALVIDETNSVFGSGLTLNNFAVGGKITITADGAVVAPPPYTAFTLNQPRPWTIQIVKRSDTAIGFEVIPRRWVVERTFAWLGRCRRMAKDWEKTIASAEAWLLIAHIRRVTRMLARQ